MKKIALAFFLLMFPVNLLATVPVPAQSGTTGIVIDEWTDTIDRRANSLSRSTSVWQSLDHQLATEIQALSRMNIQGEFEEASDIQSRYQNIQSLIEIRRYFFVHGHRSLVDDLIGFGHAGQASANIEIEALTSLLHTQWALNIHYLWDTKTGIRLDGSRQAKIASEILAVLLLIVLWRRVVIPKLSANLKASSRKDRARRTDVYWLLLRSRAPWAWLGVLLLVNWSISSNIPLADFNTLVSPLSSALILIGIGRFIYHLGSVQYHRVDVKDPTLLRRQVTVRTLFAAIAISAASLSLLEATGLSEMTIYSWTISVSIVVLLLLCVIFAFVWKARNIKTIQRKEYRNSWCFELIHKYRSGLYAPLQTILLALYLSSQWLLRSFIAILTASSVIRSWLGIFFEKMVREAHATDSGREPLPQEAREPLYLGPKQIIEVYKTEREALIRNASIPQSTVSMVYGQRAMGKTRLIKTVLANFDEGMTLDDGSKITTLYVSCPDGGFTELTETLATAMGHDAEQAAEVISQIRSESSLLIAIDNVHKLITPSLGGLSEFERLLRLVRRSAEGISWILSMDVACWRYFNRARGERYRFDLELALQAWNEDQLRQLIESTLKSNNLSADFSTVQLPRQPDEFIQLTEQEQKSGRYFRVLSQHARGNPGFALMYFTQSLTLPARKNSHHYSVGMFDLSHHGKLDTLGIEKLLILRVLAQMGRADRVRIEAATQTPTEEVTDSLRHLRNIGAVKRRENALYEISWEWYPEVLELLNRKHLLQLFGGTAS